jgi:hypothetical protein
MKCRLCSNHWGRPSDPDARYLAVLLEGGKPMAVHPACRRLREKSWGLKKGGRYIFVPIETNLLIGLHITIPDESVEFGRNKTAQFAYEWHKQQHLKNQTRIKRPHRKFKSVSKTLSEHKVYEKS